METPRGPKKPAEDKRSQSLDRSQPLRKGPEARNCPCVSQHSSRRAFRRTASDGAPSSGSPAALPLEEMREFLLSQQGPQEDPRKGGWLKTLINFLLMRTDLEEPAEKASRRPRGKEGSTEPPEAAEEPALRKKAQDKKASRKKHGHRKLSAEEPKGAQELVARGQEDALPSLPVASCAKEMDMGLARRGRPGSESPHSVPIEGGDTGPSDGSPQAAGPSSEEQLRKPDQEELKRRIVEILKKVGDQLEGELRSCLPSPSIPNTGLLPLQQGQAPPPEVTSQAPTPAPRRRSQEKKASLKKAFSFKRPGLEELRRAGSADAPGPEARPPKRPSFLPLCVGGHRTSSISSSHGSEEPRVHEVLSTDGEGPCPSEPPTQVRCEGPSELLDGTPESREFMQKILALLKSTEEPEEEQPPRVQEAEVALEILVPACKRKPHERKSSFRRAFSHKKHSSKESRRTEAAGASGPAGPEARPPRKHSFLPMCVGGHRASVSSCSADPEHPELEFREPAAAAVGGQAGGLEAPSQARSHTPDEGPWLEEAHESKELMIHKLVALLQEADGELGQQIRRHPSFKRFLNSFSDASLRKLVAALYTQKARVPEGDGSLAKSPSPCAFGLLNKFSGSHGCAICSLMRSRGQYNGHSYAHFLSRKAQLNITSLDRQSPD